MMFCSLLLATTTFAAPEPIQDEVNAVNAVESMKIVNDTDEDIRIHTGSGVVTLTRRGGSTSITCKAGTKIHTAPDGVKKDLIFTVEDSMCGTTVKLSEYL